MNETTRFDMQDVAEVNNWMATTLQYAMVSAGRDEVHESEVHEHVAKVCGGLPPSMCMREIVTATLTKAKALLGEEKESAASETIEGEYLVPVMQWALKTAAVVFVARGKPFTHEGLEAVVDDKIVGSVQGNKSAPMRDDLDRVVRKTVDWGLVELKRIPIQG